MVNNRGETITETLVSVAIVAVCFVALQTAIVSSAKMNAQAKSTNKPFRISSTDTVVSSNRIYIERGTEETDITDKVQIKKSEEVDGTSPYYYFQ